MITASFLDIFVTMIKINADIIIGKGTIIKGNLVPTPKPIKDAARTR